ncbi:MAG: hypothetical protein ACOCV1_07505 [Bacillota bacterium]
MSKYEINKKIGSCTVDKKLLLNLEDCILNRTINKLLNEYLSKEIIEKYNNNYTISIKSKNGREKEEFESIKDYKHSLLPSNTDEIEMKVTLFNNEISKNNIGLSYISININFSNSYDEKINVVIESEKKAKQIAKNIYDLIKETIVHKKNTNYIYHLTRYFKNSIFGIILSSLIFVLYLYSSIFILNSSFKYDKLILFYIQILFLFYISSSKLNPYIVFESNKSKKYKGWYNSLKQIVVYTMLGGTIVQMIYSFLL